MNKKAFMKGICEINNSYIKICDNIEDFLEEESVTIVRKYERLGSPGKIRLLNSLYSNLLLARRDFLGEKASIKRLQPDCIESVVRDITDILLNDLKSEVSKLILNNISIVLDSKITSDEESMRETLLKIREDFASGRGVLDKFRKAIGGERNEN